MELKISASIPLLLWCHLCKHGSSYASCWSCWTIFYFAEVNPATNGSGFVEWIFDEGGMCGGFCSDHHRCCKYILTGEYNEHAYLFAGPHQSVIKESVGHVPDRVWVIEKKFIPVSEKFQHLNNFIIYLEEMITWLLIMPSSQTLTQCGGHYMNTILTYNLCLWFLFISSFRVMNFIHIRTKYPKVNLLVCRDSTIHNCYFLMVFSADSFWCMSSD